MNRNARNEIRRHLREFSKLKNDSVSEQLKAIEQFRITLLQKMALVTWSMAELNKIQGIVKNIARNYAQDSSALMNEQIRRSFTKGIKQIDDMLFAHGEPVGFGYIPNQILENAQIRARTLITGLSEEMARKVNTDILLGLSGEKTAFEVMQNISQYIPPLKTKGRISRLIGAPARAETITRTEMGKAHEDAGAARRKQVFDKYPNAKKQWFATHKPLSRPAHQACESLGAVDSDYEYSVNGHPCQRPYDNDLPIGEIANCGCTIGVVIEKE